ncbi:hypothetical protein IWX81_002728 [Salinibacterium sp. CAN_S4]|uniref:hypothetical protein n=1 Tax=Salinibacterium sp. CAN_S4 TaxID=2787727 RepID=UPI0018F00E09
MTGLEQVSIQLDRAWWPLGDGTDSAAEIADALITSLVPTLGEPSVTALRSDLVSFADWSQSLAPGERRSFALVRYPEQGRVDALLSWRFSRIEGDVYDDYLALARSQQSTDRVELVNQRVLEFTLGLGRAVVVHDILLMREGGVLAPARERCTIGFFVDSEPALIELHLATMDLSLFDDIVEFALALVAGQDPGVPGQLEHRRVAG